MGLASLGLGGVLADAGDLLAAVTIPDGQPRDLAPRAPHFAPRAKRVIQFFLNGGPSHVDTFDPKPALQKYAGKELPGLCPRNGGLAQRSWFSPRGW